jgi:hypothetical protein
VVDVRVAVTRHPAVVQETHPRSTQELVEAGPRLDLVVAALFPRPRALWLVDHLGQEHAESAELLSRVLLPSQMPAFVFAQRARAGLAGVDRCRARGILRCRVGGDTNVVGELARSLKGAWTDVRHAAFHPPP